MISVREMIQREERRIYVLSRINDAGRDGYLVMGDEPGWWRDTVLDLNNDRLIYPSVNPQAGTRFTWFISDAGKAALKAVRS